MNLNPIIFFKNYLNKIKVKRQKERNRKFAEMLYNEVYGCKCQCSCKKKK
jgi:hypothetical protein